MTNLDNPANHLASAGRPTLFVGDEMLVLQCAVESANHGLSPVAIVSSNDLVLAEAAGSGILAIDRRLASSIVDAVSNVDFEVLFSIAFRHILPTALLDRAQLALNFHDGPLPHLGGLNVTTWSVLNNESEHGVTWHEMSALADRGDIVHEVRFPVAPNETAFSLNARCYEAGLASFPAVAAAAATDSLQRTPQTDEGRRMYRRVERPRVFVDPALPAVELARAIRSIDLGPRAENALGSPRWVASTGDGADYLVVESAQVDNSDSDGAQGDVEVVGDQVVLQTVDGRLSIDRMVRPDGSPIPAAEAATIMAPAGTTSSPDSALVEALEASDEQLAKSEDAWRLALGAVSIERSPVLSNASAGGPVTIEIDTVVEQSTLVAAVALWLNGVNGEAGAVIECTDPAARAAQHALPLLRAPLVDLGVESDDFHAADRVGDISTVAVERLDAALARGAFLSDLVARDPELRSASLDADVAVHLDVDVDDALASISRSARIEVLRRIDGSVAVRHAIDAATGDRVAGQLAAVLSSLDAADPASTPLRDITFMSDSDVELVSNFNQTAVDFERGLTLDAQFRAQCAATPTANAVSAGGLTLTYSELAADVDRMAALLTSTGVTPGDGVGLALDRGIDMVVAMLATISVGAHYLPLDPTYPADRLEFMVTDSGTSVIVARAEAADLFSAIDVKVVDPESRVDVTGESPVAAVSGPESLAYTIYTSGSTGLPKGVELEHRQVSNFFVAMDAVIGRDPGVWLAVTSLSFDISVLELLWTLTRGFHVVVKRDSGLKPASSPSSFGPAGAVARPSVERRGPVDTRMSLFYFAADEDQAATGYRLLLESAKWGDENGFDAVWTPERHFHSFGAPYPNPSVVGAALAATTENIGIRAGSVVIPLHSPIRIAEEWAVVDNLSGGRVGLSFAAGWQPNDFVLNPGAYATARDSLPGLVDTVQRLWRGETVELPGHDGAPVAVSTLPRPIQPELPIWITSAGSPASFERAGTLGHNILTHLVGQTVEQLAANISGYRAAWNEAGHDGDGSVSLMLHTYLHDDGDFARDTARAPLKGYLGTAVGLLKDLASAFPTFHKAGKSADEAFRSLTDDEMSQLLDLATERYLVTAGLFGTIEDAEKMVDTVVNAGVDEIACLIDFGIDDDMVLASLDLLGRVHDRVNEQNAEHLAAAQNGLAPAAAAPVDVPETFAGLVEHYGVTHFQCTPSLASMLVADPADRAAFRSVNHMMVGGEALPVALGTELRELLPERFTNMYGPTETTIWSLVHELDEISPAGVPIGRPIANTTMFVLDALGRDVPVGAFGELYLGGEGVARGYHDRPELTGDRFREVGDKGRIYATGDVVRVRPDGIVEFGGRSDNQVKIRGHRIELSEIESVIDNHGAVTRSVVVAKGDGEPTLVAYVVLRDDADEVAGPDIRAWVGESLPDAMVPSAVAVLDALPLTPNGKIDRKRLPDVSELDGGNDEPLPEFSSDDAEAFVTAVWRRELGQPVGVDDNFFDIGGHSLLAVTVFRELGSHCPALALTDVFRYPTIRTFADHMAGLLGGDGALAAAAPAAPTGTDRGAMRRRARGRRGGS